MEKNKKHRLWIEGQSVNVTREVYTVYRRMERRERYLDERDLAHGKTHYSALDTLETAGEDALFDREAASVEDIVIGRIATARLRACLALLSESELALIVKRYYEDRSQRDVAAELGLNQSNVCRREERILEKLRRMIEE